MSLRSWLYENLWEIKSDESLDESLDVFKNKGDPLSSAELAATQGEGIEQLPITTGAGAVGFYGINSFFNNYINLSFENEVQKILEYRRMSQMAEIQEVIDDAVIESTQEDENGDIIKLTISDTDIEANANISNMIQQEFNELFNKRINFNEICQDLFRTYYIDGRVFWENIIDKRKPKDGIQRIKKLPSESCSYQYDVLTGQILKYYQFLTVSASKPLTPEEAERDPNTISFEPQQISFINTGNYGRNKKEIIGPLEKVKQPYNQLKLLETSVVIYRLVRAPERYVFKIDCGVMPVDKADKYVEKMKQKLITKVSFNPDTGELSNSTSLFNTLDNFFLPAGPNRGSDISSIGGNSTQGFTELSDIKYFAAKMYRALKYPMSRVNNSFQSQDALNTFNFGGTGDIPRDEIKWAKYLQLQQNKFARSLEELFLIHLDFKGIRKHLGLTREKILIKFTPPNNFEENMKQKIREIKFQNFSQLYMYKEFSKFYLAKKFLGWDDSDWEENKNSFDKDLELLPITNQLQGFGNFGGGTSDMESDQPEQTNQQYGEEEQFSPENQEEQDESW